jgi:hypothetical protein
VNILSLIFKKKTSNFLGFADTRPVHVLSPSYNRPKFFRRIEIDQVDQSKPHSKLPQLNSHFQKRDFDAERTAKQTSDVVPNDKNPPVLSRRMRMVPRQNYDDYDAEENNANEDSDEQIENNWSDRSYGRQKTSKSGVKADGEFKLSKRIWDKVPKSSGKNDNYDMDENISDEETESIDEKQCSEEKEDGIFKFGNKSKSIGKGISEGNDKRYRRKFFELVKKIGKLVGKRGKRIKSVFKPERKAGKGIEDTVPAVGRFGSG